MNKINLVGRWTKDAELSFLPGNGTAVLKGILAVDRKFKKEGQPSADFIPVVIWGKQAESTSNYCSLKGNQIGISGRIQTRTYDATDGTKKYITEVVAEEVYFLTYKGAKETNNTQGTGGQYDYGADMTPVDDGEIPF